MYEFLILSKVDGIGTITLNRPDVYNSFNDGITFEIQRALKEVSEDESIRVVVLTGAGKAFCAGQDLKEAAENTGRSFSESLDTRYHPIIKSIRTMPKPVICRLNGVAAGAGCSLALACDLIIASEEASLIEVFVNIGLVLDSGSSYFLPRLVGSSKAFELATMGSKIGAKEAEKLGLVNKAVPSIELDAAVTEYTTYYVNAPTKAIGLMKKMLNNSYNSSLDEMLELEAKSQDIAGSTTDHAEGISAFLEKRKAKFTGN